MQADDLVACYLLGLLNRANHAIGDERVHGWVRPGRPVVGNHEAWGIANRAAVSPTAVALVLIERLGTHHDGPDTVEHLLQDGPIHVGRRVEHPVVQHPGAIAERVLAAVIRAGDVAVERGGHVADHQGHECFLSVRPIGATRTVLSYTDDVRRRFSSTRLQIKAPPSSDRRTGGSSSAQPTDPLSCHGGCRPRATWLPGVSRLLSWRTEVHHGFGPRSPALQAE